MAARQHDARLDNHRRLTVCTPAEFGALDGPCMRQGRRLQYRAARAAAVNAALRIEDQTAARCRAGRYLRGRSGQNHAEQRALELESDRKSVV